MSLIRSDSLIIVTTHEQDISRNLAKEYDNFYFTEEIQEGSIAFDYKLQEGIVDRSNALRLLRHVGFPQNLLPESDSCPTQL